ncbi:MAG TPA: ComEA family DNA-binding protein [Ktedonobacteraceae bacterium]|nr:ComEA family DNA-binding protein [Ktedonobacteraceae bacterium]
MHLQTPQHFQEQWSRYTFSLQETASSPAIAAPQPSLPALPIVTLNQEEEQPPSVPAQSKKALFVRLFAAGIVLALILVLYFTWHTSPAPSSATSIIQQNVSNISTRTPAGTTTSNASNGTMQTYIVGAVKHPGVYTLEVGARVYQLLQAAGGPLSDANLVALNLAAKLSDGQEVYVSRLGETPPTYQGGVPGVASNTPGQLVNINTASVDELRQQLNISSQTAQTIISYRLQHGDFTSVEQLSQVVSKTIYDKIKGLVTVS